MHIYLILYVIIVAYTVIHINNVCTVCYKTLEKENFNNKYCLVFIFEDFIEMQVTILL